MQYQKYYLFSTKTLIPFFVYINDSFFNSNNIPTRIYVVLVVIFPPELLSFHS